MKEVTLDNLIDEVKAIEAVTAEPPELTYKIQIMAKNFLKLAANSIPVKILTDYDADGICFGYIAQKTLKAINPDMDVEVICNDRRNPYGVPKDLKAEEGVQYIVGDMGSNELSYIHQTFGRNTLILDHHIIEDREANLLFNNWATLLNAHCMKCDDGKSAEYCATGLAYRVYQETIRLAADPSFENNIDYERVCHSLTDEKFANSMAIVASIGTSSDMVNVLDPHSYNRDILKKGIELINNADETNIDYALGRFLSVAGIGETDVTAKKIAFNVGALLNSASRMSEILQENGAQRMFEAFAGESNAANYFAIDELSKINKQRKDYLNGLKDEKYYSFIESHCFGEDKNKQIAIYELPPNTPTAFAGLISGQLTDATGKPSIVLTYHDDTKCFSGSGRNAKDKDNLKDFIDKAIEGLQLDIKYGGHADAIGVSRIGSREDADMFIAALNESPYIIKSKDEEPIRLKIDPSKISSKETVDKLLALEPVGIGLTIPPIEIEGKEVKTSVKAKNPHWVGMNIQGVGQVTDWSYNENSYPKDKSGNIKLLATMELNDFRGLHAELTAMYNADFLKERQKEITNQSREKPSVAVPRFGI